MSPTSLDERDLLSKGLKGTIPLAATRSQPAMHQIATSEASPKKKKKRPIWRRWYTILGVLLLLWLVVSAILGKREKPIPVTTEKAIRKTIVQTVSSTGKIQPEVEVKISPEVAGKSLSCPW